MATDQEKRGGATSSGAQVRGTGTVDPAPSMADVGLRNWKIARRLQRKKQGAEAPAAEAHVPSPQAGIHTITDPAAYAREGPPHFKSTGKVLPVGARVEISDEITEGKAVYVEVKDHDSGANLGWTAKTNLGDVAFAQSGAQYVYESGGHPLMVYVPPGLKTTPADPVDVFMFFHGWYADYASAGVDNFQKEDPGKAADLAGAARAAAAGGRNVIVIAPQVNSAHNQKSPWEQQKSGSYEAMVATTFGNLKEDLKLPHPLKRGAVSLAGHSGGGKALGQATADLDSGDGGGVTDITLQEAGYGGHEGAADGAARGDFAQSFQMVRTWLTRGKGPKVLRVITKATHEGTDTRHALEGSSTEEHEDKKTHKKSSQKLLPVLSEDRIRHSVQADPDLEVKATEVTETLPRTGGMHLIRKIEIVHKGSGNVQGTLYLFLMADPPRAKGVDPHFGVRDQIMSDNVAAGNKGDGFGAKP